MKTVVIVQARMNSTRLPGKVMLLLAGETMLARLLERLRRVKKANAVVIATTTNSSDDVIALWAQAHDVTCHRGSELDVLARYAEAAREAAADVVVRVTSDCPLLDPVLVDQAITAFEVGDCDYVSNMLPPTWPYGMAVEVFSIATLIQAHREAIQDAEREHVTPFIYWHPERYRLKNLTSPENLSHHRWTVDTPEDYQLVQLIFDSLYRIHPEFALADVLSVMQTHPDWMRINQHIAQKQATPTPPFRPHGAHI